MDSTFRNRSGVLGGMFSAHREKRRGGPQHAQRVLIPDVLLVGGSSWKQYADATAVTVDPGIAALADAV